MHTYHPQLGYAKTARMLDDRRLEKQIETAYSILVAIDNREDTPEARMWTGYQRALCLYGLMMANEWRIGRGHACGYVRFFSETDDELKAAGMTAGRPPWNNDKNICRAHRALIVRRTPAFEKYWTNNPNDMPMLWPQNLRDGGYRLRLSEADVRRLARGERKLPDWLEWNSNQREVIALYEPDGQ